MGNMNTMNNQKEMHDFPNKKMNNPNANPNPNPNPNPNILSDANDANANSTKNEINPNDSTSVLNPKSSRPVNPIITGNLLALLLKPKIKLKRMMPLKSFRGIKALTGSEQDLNSKKSIVLKSTSQQINLTSQVRFYYYVLINTFDCILTS